MIGVMGSDEPDVVTCTQGLAEGVLMVTLDRPQRRNAMSAALVDRLLALLQEMAGQAAIGAIVFAGAGRGFCAGSDLAELASADAVGRAAFEAASGRLARGMVAHPLPILAAVHGFAIGGGMTLAAACDIVVTAPDAHWSLPEVPIGLFPAWGLEPVSDRVGRPMARRLAWGIDTLDGKAACAAGLADLVAEAPLEAALGLAAQLAALPRGQAAAVKSYFSRVRRGEAADDMARALFTQACLTPEAAASLARFGRAVP